MLWTIIVDVVAAVLLVGIACNIRVNTWWQHTWCRVLPILVAFSLTISAAARFFGWPIQ